MVKRILFLMLFTSFNSVILSKVLFYNLLEINKQQSEYKTLCNEISDHDMLLCKKKCEFLRNAVMSKKYEDMRHSLFLLTTEVCKKYKDLLDNIATQVGAQRQAHIMQTDSNLSVSSKNNITDVIIKKLKSSEKAAFKEIRKKVKSELNKISKNI